MTASDTWTTRDGRRVRIADMETEHLLNTIRFLRRRANVLRMQLLTKMSRYIEQAPEGAAAACSAEADLIIEMSDGEFLSACVPQWKALIKEAAKRRRP